MPRLLLLALLFTTACLDDCLESKVVRYDGGVCASNTDCADAGQYCDLPTSTCVACVTNAHCGGEPTTPTCDAETKACRACTSSADCTGATGGSVCEVDSGRCVACLTDATCGSGTCDVTTNACTAVAPGSVARCGACVSDSQCGSGSVCVLEEFQGEPVGYVCLPLPEGGQCATTDAPNPTLRPYSEPRSAESISTSANVSVCAPISSVACSSIRDIESTCIGDEECGGGSSRGGVCGRIGATPNLCSVYCGLHRDCPLGRTCSTSIAPIGTCQ